MKAFFFSYLLVHRNFSVISFPPRACLLKSELSKFSTKLISRTKGSRRVPGKKKGQKVSRRQSLFTASRQLATCQELRK